MKRPQHTHRQHRHEAPPATHANRPRSTLWWIGHLCCPLILIAALWLPQRPACESVLLQILEPGFVSPVDLPEEPSQPPEALPIRNDMYGEGHFGARRRGGRSHAGIDLAAPMHSPVYASRSGWVTTDYRKKGYGNLVIMRHFDGSETRYAHLQRVDVQTGEWAWQGQQIGTIGKTGNASGRGLLPHVHFEIRRADTPVDPTPYLTEQPPTPWDIVVAAIHTSCRLERITSLVRTPRVDPSGQERGG